MKKIQSTLAIAAIAAAIAAPVNLAHASEGPFEIGGKTVFEIQRETRDVTKVEETNKTDVKVADKTENSWFKRIFGTQS